jgi:hypothetical protein
MREVYRELLRPLGVVPETVYLATDRATVLQRVGARTAKDGDDFAISAGLASRSGDTPRQQSTPVSRRRPGSLERAAIRRARRG